MDENRPMGPEEWQRFKTQLIGMWIENRRRLYKRHQNPIHALNAYRIARSTKIEIPDWILEVFDKWAATLCVDSPKGAKAIADALGLGTKGGPSLTLQAENQARNLKIAERVLLLLDKQPEKGKLDIFGRVGEEFNLSAERVSGIWYKLTCGIKH
jgi:hypothetical protein